ncbi:hypothetical protein FQA39_LY06493 [Lamprigera yunnana]|nr:hypothetical protein FQA39_LY06493 [Lamprigera yunnana]
MVINHFKKVTVMFTALRKMKKEVLSIRKIATDYQTLVVAYNHGFQIDYDGKKQYILKTADGLAPYQISFHVLNLGRKKKFYNTLDPRDAEELLKYLEELNSEDEDYSQVNDSNKLTQIQI